MEGSHRGLQEEALVDRLFLVDLHPQWVLEGRLRQLGLVDHAHLSLPVEVGLRSRLMVWGRLLVVSQEVHLHLLPTAALQMAIFLLSQVISLPQAKDLLVKALRVFLVLLPLSRKGPQQTLDRVGCTQIE